MSTRVTLTGTKLDALPLTDERLMRQIGEKAIVMIRQRTQDRGLDRHGVPFRSYSPGYALRKEHGGGRVFDVSGYGRVTLTLTGDMLNHLSVLRTTKRSVTLGWSR